MSRFGAISRNSRKASRPRVPGICSSSKTRSKARRRSSSAPSSAYVVGRGKRCARVLALAETRNSLQIGRVNGSQGFFAPTAPPYALSSPAFRFRALAVLAGRAPLGGQREVALATYLAARLADDCL